MRAAAVVARELSCSAACGIFPDQGSNPRPLHCRRTPNHCSTREALLKGNLTQSSVIKLSFRDYFLNNLIIKGKILTFLKFIPLFLVVLLCTM